LKKKLIYRLRSFVIVQIKGQTEIDDRKNGGIRRHHHHLDTAIDGHQCGDMSESRRRGDVAWI